MRFITPITICVSLLSVAITASTDASNEVDIKVKRDLDLDLRHLAKRNCSENGCKCHPGTPQGTYCGFCSAVTDSGSGYYRDIYECNPGGGCCSYGKSTKCAGSNWADWCPK